MPQFLRQYLLVSETKVNKEFPNARFLLSNYEKKYRKIRSHVIYKMMKIPSFMTRIIISSELKKWIVLLCLQTSLGIKSEYIFSRIDLSSK